MRGEQVLAAVRAFHRRRPTPPVGRTLDLVIALTGLILLWPLLFALAIAIKATSRGPVLFRHRRVGLGGTTFECLKFRTMVLGAEARLSETLAGDPALAREFREKHKLTDDPRITPIGRFLRRTSLDELPQLFNVLRGDMSVVGPRPVVIDECLRYGDAMATVCSVRPGITGLWQISGRNDVDYDERVTLDVRYVEHKTRCGDLAICLRTAFYAATGGLAGAY